jgi:diguanylate cyclase (GGDEF)-like protein/PAS domain S-box-containing protein
MRARPDGDGGEGLREVGDARPRTKSPPTTDPLEAERDLLAAVVERAPIGILITDAANRVLRVNRAFCDVVANSGDEMIGIDASQLSHHEDVGFDILAREQLLAGEDDTLRRTTRYLRPDGSTVLADVSTTLVRHTDGSPRFFVSEVRDITAESDAQEKAHHVAMELRASERHFRMVASSAPACLFESDTDGRCIWVNERWAELTGRSPSDALEEGWLCAVHPEDREAVAAAWSDACARDAPFAADCRFEHGDGSTRWVAVTAAPVETRKHGRTRLFGVIVDVTQGKRAEELLKDTQELFRRSFEDAPIGMILGSLDGEIDRANDALVHLLGLDLEEIQRRGLYGLVHPEDGNVFRSEIDRLARGRVGAVTVEGRLLAADGSAVWTQIAASRVRGADGRSHVLVQLQDVTERHDSEQQLRWMADHDPLTGLANRRKLENEIESHLRRTERSGPRGSLLLFDLDHFKAVNDTLGHKEGDNLLQAIAQILRGRLRASDLAVRLGGDEFAVLLPEGDETEARVVAESIGRLIRDYGASTYPEQPFRVSASLGIALFSDMVPGSPESMLGAADLALYDVKQSGRDGYVFFLADRHDREHELASVSWGHEIRVALDDDRLIIHAQPIRDLQTGETELYEILVRLVTRDGQIVPPGAFLGIAERSDLIHAIDRRVVEKAVALASERRRRGSPVRLAVNLSAKSLVEPSLVEAIENAISADDCHPGDLVFEITETAAVSNIKHARFLAVRLATFGCHLALDDFGAGFGSFYYLKHLPFDYLKIDGEFVRGLVDDPIDKLVIEAVVRIAQGLGKRTIAEFVENEETLEILRRSGVDLVQGYLIGRPADAAEILGLHDLAPAEAAVVSPAEPTTAE